MNDNNKNKIMGKVIDGSITMKKRWIFIAKEIGLQSGLILTVIVSIFFVNAFFFYIKSNDLLLPFHFGPSIWQKFLHSLPYDLILIIVVLLVFLNYIIKKFDFSYKMPFAVIVLVSLVFVVLSAFIIFNSNFNFLIKGRLQNSDIHIPYISEFYINRCH